MECQPIFEPQSAPSLLTFPTGLRLAVYLLARPTYVWVWLLSDMLLAGVILVLLPDQSSPLMLLMPWVVWLAAVIARQHWPKLHLYWQKLLLIVALVLLHTILVGITFTLLAKPLHMGGDVNCREYRFAHGRHCADPIFVSGGRLP